MPLRLPMVWLLLLFFFVLILIPPKFRLHGLGFLILVMLAGFLLTQPEEEKILAARDLIPLEQIAIRELELQRSHGVGYELRGKLLNHSSDYALTGLGLALTIQDCPADESIAQSPCTPVEAIQTHLSLWVPPQEVREFKKRLYFRELHLQGQMKWEHTLLYSEAREQGFWEKFYPRR
jgi:hypothetical protein